MSRNPYLAASRPSSSFTRSSRSASRATSGASFGGSLGRSRSSANLGAPSASQYSSATGSSYTSSTYLPAPKIWHQRPSSSSRLGSSTSAFNRPCSSGYDGRVRQNDNPDLGRKISDEREVPSSLLRSASSSYLKSSPRSKDDEEETEQITSHLQNYQQSKLQQPNPILSSQTVRAPIQSLDTSTDINNNSNNIIDDDDGPNARRSNLQKSFNDSETEPIGAAIPSASARHLVKSSQIGGQLLTKSKSVELPQEATSTTESHLLSSSMSVDRLLLRAESMGENDLRKSFKELVMENERLKLQLKGLDDQEKQQQLEWIRKERQLQRKISELEEENKQVEHWKQEIQRLKEENSSLIRVVSKLSKH